MVRACRRCGEPIPESKRSDAVYCSVRCRKNDEKLRFKNRHPDYTARQVRLTKEWRHLKEYGHLEFIDRPDLNPKDRFGLARSLGFRSMLEYRVAQQLKAAGMGFRYEPFKIPYTKPGDLPDDYGAE